MSPPARETRRQRRRMVARQLVDRGIRQCRVLAAMAWVPREWFVPPHLAGDAYDEKLAELRLLARRIHLVLWSMGLAVFSALLVCLLIGAAFGAAFVSLDLSRFVAALFLAAVIALTGCLILFMREVFLAALSVHPTVWPQPGRVERK